jgi:hypothetical protein
MVNEYESTAVRDASGAITGYRSAITGAITPMGASQLPTSAPTPDSGLAASARQAAVTFAYGNPTVSDLNILRESGVYGSAEQAAVSRYVNKSATSADVDLLTQKGYLGSSELPKTNVPAPVQTPAAQTYQSPAAQIAAQQERLGGYVDPNLLKVARGEGYIGSVSTPAPGSSNLGSVMPLVDKVAAAQGLPMSIPSSQFEGKTVTAYVPLGSYKATELENAKIALQPTTGEAAYYQKPYGSSYYKLVGGGGVGALQSGMFTVGKPETPAVYTQESGGKTFAPSANVPEAMKLLAHPELYSRAGAEVYGGNVTPLTGATVESTGARLSTYANPLNLANYVNPQGVNLPKSEMPLANAPYKVSAESPAIMTMGPSGITGAINIPESAKVSSAKPDTSMFGGLYVVPGSARMVETPTITPTPITGGLPSVNILHVGGGFGAMAAEIPGVQLGFGTLRQGGFKEGGAGYSPVVIAPSGAAVPIAQTVTPAIQISTPLFPTTTPKGVTGPGTLGGLYVVPGSITVVSKGTPITNVEKPVTIGSTNIPSTFSDVSNFFKNAPILSSVYDIGSKVSSGEIPVLSTVYKIGGETKLSSATPVGGFISGISQGGAATEAYYDYQKVANVNTEKINELTPGYEKSLSEYNKNLGSYNVNATKMQEGYDNLLTQQKNIESESALYNKNLEAYKVNPTTEGYNSLISQQKNLQSSIDTYSKNVDVFNKQTVAPTQKEYENLLTQQKDLDIQQGKISALQGQIDTAESHYQKSTLPLTGGVDQTKLVTYGVGSAIGDVGKWYNENIETPLNKGVSGWGIPGQIISGLAETPEMVTQLGQSALVGGETILRNPAAFAGLATAGLAMQAGGMYQSATTNPAKFAGSLAGQYLLFKGGEKLYEAQPYRVGLQRAEIISSKGTEPPTAKFTSFATSKLSGAEKQIEQISTPIIGVGGKTVAPTDVILGSNLLKGGSEDILFTTKMNIFADASQAAQRYINVAKGGTSEFYHVTPENAFTNRLLTKGSVVVGEGGKEGALFFGDPGTILKQYAGETGANIALRLRTTPEITPEFASAVSKIKSSGAYGRNFADVAATLPPGKLYPGLRAAAGKPWKGLGLEEEYVVAPKTTLYLKGAENIVSPTGERWAILDVSTKPQLLPNLKYGAVKAVSTLKNIRPYVGTPKPTAEMLKFKTEGSTYAMESPLEVAIGKKYIAPEESAKIDLAYKTHEITSGSGAKYEQASTAIGEVVKARKFPNPAEVTEAILQTSLDYGAKLYGSAGQKAVGIEKGVTTLLRSPNDIDVMIPGEAGQPGKLSLMEGLKRKVIPSKETSLTTMGDSYAQDVTNAINKAAGKKVVHVKDGTVEMSDGSGKLFDIHNENPTINELLKQEVSPFRSPSGYFGLGMKPQKYVSTVEGLEVMPYAEQVGRKASGAMEVTAEPRTVASKEYEGGPKIFSVTGKIAPRFEGRMKDIGDYYIGEKGNIELMSRSSNPLTRAKAAKADKYLEQWLDLWGEDASTKIRQNYAGGKFEIDLSSPSTAGSKPLKLSTTPVWLSTLGSTFGFISKYPSFMSVGSVKPSVLGSQSIIPSKEKDLSDIASRYAVSIGKSVGASISKSSSEISKGVSSVSGSLPSLISEPSVPEISLPSIFKSISPVEPSISTFSLPSPKIESPPSGSTPSIPSTKISPPSAPSIPTSVPPSGPVPSPSSPKLPSPILFPPGGSNLPPGSGGGGHKRKFKPHVQLFEYNFDPWKAARITAKALAVGSNVTRGPKSSLPTSIFAQKPTSQNIVKAPSRVATPKINMPTQKKSPAPSVVAPKFNLPAQKSQFTMPKINAPKSTNTLKSMSLSSSLPQKKKGKK